MARFYKSMKISRLIALRNYKLLTGNKEYTR